MLLIGADRVIAQALHLPAGFAPPGTQRGATFAVDRAVAGANHKAVTALRAADHMTARCEPLLRQHLFHCRAIFGLDLNHRAQLFGKERGQRVAAQRGDIDLDAAVAGKGHFRQRDQQAAV